MNFLNHQFVHKRRLLTNGLLVLVTGAAAVLWMSAGQVQASEAPVAQFQTLPPTPTPAPTAPPPTPTPRPRDDNRPAQPAPTPTVAGATDPAPGATTSTLTGVINATTLNVRQGPGSTFPVVGRLPNGTVVTVVARNADNTWLNICCLPDSETRGWVSAQFVTPNYNTAELAALSVDDGATLPADAPRGTVAAVSLNVREAASTSAALLGKLGNGTAVTLLGRNDAGDWWLICCAPGGAGNGWVAAQFIATDAAEAVLAALPVTTGRDTPAAATPAPAATPVAASEAISPTVLTLAAALQPTFPVQGEQVVFAFTLTNTGEAAAVDAELSFEMPVGLSFVGASAEDGGEVAALDTDSGASLIVVTWPELAAGGATIVKITATVDTALANGAVIDGAAAALADNAASTSVAVSIGMPPAAPPDFQ
jgi:uncharacterized repeat protein (TIGR01451 family)